MTNLNIGRRTLLGAAAGITLVGIAGPRAAAATRYVSTKPQLAAALIAALPGDEIVLADGPWTDVEINIGSACNHGTALNPITLRAETLGGVALTGISRVGLGRDYWIVRGLRFVDGYSTLNQPVIGFRGDTSSYAGVAGTVGNHCQVLECVISWFNPPSALRYPWVYVFGTGNRVGYCHFVGKQHEFDLLSGCYVSANPRPTTIDHNYFGRIADGGANDYGAVTTGTGATTTGLADDHWVIENNLFDRCNGESEIISVKSSSNIVRSNTFLRSVGNISLRFGNDTQVSDNWFLADGSTSSNPSGIRKSGGVRVTGERHRIYNNYIHSVAGTAILVHDTFEAGVYRVVKDVEIVHNTIVNSLEVGIAVGVPFTPVPGQPVPENTPPESLDISNNIVWTTNGTPLTDTAPGAATYAQNIMYGSAIGVSPTPSGIMVTNPLMELATGAYSTWIPSSASPAIDSATDTYPYVVDDIEGRSRPLSNQDIGCRERTASTPTRGPLTMADVGPSYPV